MAAPPLVRRTRSASAAERADAALGPPDIDVAIFWDYENIELPSSKEAVERALTELCEVGRGHGRLVETRLYADSQKCTLATKHRAVLERAGITLIDCPTNDKKEAVDKKILVDVLFWALPLVTRSVRCVVVIVSSDGDFCHLLSRLRGAGVRTVAIGRSRALNKVANVAIDELPGFGRRSAKGCQDSTAGNAHPESGRKRKRTLSAATNADAAVANGAQSTKRARKRESASLTHAPASSLSDSAAWRSATGPSTSAAASGVQDNAHSSSFAPSTQPHSDAGAPAQLVGGTSGALSRGKRSRAQGSNARITLVSKQGGVMRKRAQSRSKRRAAKAPSPDASKAKRTSKA